MALSRIARQAFRYLAVARRIASSQLNRGIHDYVFSSDLLDGGEGKNAGSIALALRRTGAVLAGWCAFELRSWWCFRKLVHTGAPAVTSGYGDEIPGAN